MTTKYNYKCCKPQFTSAVYGQCCFPRSAAGPGAIPESDRMQKQQCPTMMVTTLTASCSGSIEKERIIVPTTAPQPILNVSSSAYTRIKTQEVLNAASDPYNPATRFAQYFPPAPVPYECPERIPNNIPIGPETPCIPAIPYKGSAQQVEQDVAALLDSLTA